MSAALPYESIELAIARLIRDIQTAKKEGRPPPDVLAGILYPGMERLLQMFIRDKLSDCTDIVYNSDLAKSLISLDNFTDILTENAVSEVNKARPIQVTDKSRFGVHMETIGLNIGWSSDQRNRSIVPDGNVIVLATLTAFIAALFLMKQT